ncbi:hypothetical protein [Hymenobacter sp. UYP22]|uniref:hypothetical protein n=1 Tax=Hymenobacter sp. UYP22 TaxID=3156348 RepID=UPI003390FAB8
MKENQVIYPLPEQVRCLRREVTMRYAVYPGRVAAQKITQADMDREIGTMEAAADTIEKMAKNGLFRETWNTLAAARTRTHAELTQDIADSQVRANQLTKDGNLASAQAECVKLAGLTLRLSELIAELLEKPQASAPGASAPALAVPVPSAIAAARPLEYASVEQRENIIRLLNHPAITRQKKTNVLLNINKYTPEMADIHLNQLQGLIDEHEGPVTFRKAS